MFNQAMSNAFPHGIRVREVVACQTEVKKGEDDDDEDDRRIWCLRVESIPGMTGEYMTATNAQINSVPGLKNQINMVSLGNALTK
jgi:hypothetical protein